MTSLLHGLGCFRRLGGLTRPIRGTSCARVGQRSSYLLLGALALAACQQDDPQSVSTIEGREATASSSSFSSGPAGPDPAMRDVPAGGFSRGEGNFMVEVSGFRMDRSEVTVAAFGQFVESASFVSEAERWGWSLVFRPEATSQPELEHRVPGTPWWLRVDGASWRNPHADGQIAPDDHPVVHVSWNDAVAFCSWRQARLPTEAEWEYASLGGESSRLYPWGDELKPDGTWRGNVWQGNFPHAEHGDGHAGLAPVGSYEANGYDLVDLGGNVWEWASDWFAADYYATAPPSDPPGPSVGQNRVLRGGSWLCSESYCEGYRRDNRNSAAPDSGLDNTGFRCVRSASEKG